MRQDGTTNSQTMSLAKLVICCCLATLAWVAAQEEVEVVIPQGTLKGLKSTTVYQGKPMYSFKGIPYAKPNVGPNKFRDPQPADPWTGVLDATQHRSTCVFYCMVRAGLFGEEDCLFLNVYTPDVNTNGKKAVMVWFHPGGFNGGSGDDDLFGPDFLIEKDVILVTLNSRLGALGFLNTGDANAPGNAGLKDQTMALRWVRDNIKNFGGCPKRVTIFGVSSGASSVQYHMMSPMSQGLFKNAITQSGSTSGSWAYSNMPKEAAFMLGEQLGVKTTDTAELVTKLAAFPAKELVDASAIMAKQANHLNGFMHVFVPSAEADVGQEIFLPADPWELIKSGKIADVPLMSGINADEGGLFAGMVMQQTTMVQDNFDLFIPSDLNMTDSAKRKELGESIKKFYFKGKMVSKDTSQEVTDLLSDVIFSSGSTLTTEIINSRITSPVYEYLFTFYAPFGFMKALFQMEDGVVHGDDMTYLFYSNAFKNKPSPGSDTEKMTNIMTEMWTNFAKESDPTPNMDGMVKTKWEPRGQDDKYLEINVTPAMKKGIIKDRVSFWADAYKSILGDYAKLFA